MVVGSHKGKVFVYRNGEDKVHTLILLTDIIVLLIIVYKFSSIEERLELT